MSIRWMPCPDCTGPNSELLVLEDTTQQCKCRGTGIIDRFTGRPPEKRFNAEASLIKQIQEKLNK